MFSDLLFRVDINNKEGREEGRQEEITKVVKNEIVKGMEVEDIVDLTGLTKKDIDKIRKEMLQ